MPMLYTNICQTLFCRRKGFHVSYKKRNTISIYIAHSMLLKEVSNVVLMQNKNYWKKNANIDVLEKKKCNYLTQVLDVWLCNWSQREGFWTSISTFGIRWVQPDFRFFIVNSYNGCLSTVHCAFQAMDKCW